MYPDLHPKLEAPALLADGLVAVAREFIKAAKRLPPAAARPKRGATLRPGPNTPMWNALVSGVQPYLQRYGAKSKLARFLDVPPQRIHAYFVARTQAADAERTLLLMSWLASAAQRGKAPG